MTKNDDYNMRTLSIVAIGLEDLIGALQRHKLICFLAYHDIRQRYQRSILGPFWITISMAVMIACLGVIFGSLFRSPINEFLPYLAAGLILWNFISGCITDSATVFIVETRTMLQMPLPLSAYVAKVIIRNSLIMFHNILIFPFLMLVFDIRVGIEYLYFIPGLLLITFNLFFVCLALAIICVRFRDLTQIISSLLQIAFYASPIIWTPELIMETGRRVILDVNPIYYLLDLARNPLLGMIPNHKSWVIVFIMLATNAVLVLFFLGKTRFRVAYWL